MTIIETLRARNSPRPGGITPLGDQSLLKPKPPLDPKTTEIIENMVATTNERNLLRDSVHSLEAELSETRRRAQFLEDEVDKLRHERDFYMRHSTAITVRLNDIGHLINLTLEDAKRAAYAPKLSGAQAAQEAPAEGGGTPTSDTLPESDVSEGARDIASRFAPEPIQPLTTQEIAK